MPTPGFLPLRLRLSRALVGLEAHSHSLMPLGPLLLDMLSWKGAAPPYANSQGPVRSMQPWVVSGQALLLQGRFWGWTQTAAAGVAASVCGRAGVCDTAAVKLVAEQGRSVQAHMHPQYGPCVPGTSSGLCADVLLVQP